MSERIDALVNVNMTRRKAAAVIGCRPSEVVQWGNGYAVVNLKDEPAPADEPDEPEDETQDEEPEADEDE